KPQCWENGCNGRQSSTFSNLIHHQREKSSTATKNYCSHYRTAFILTKPKTQRSGKPTPTTIASEPLRKIGGDPKHRTLKFLAGLMST
ncbi:uncharacterized protein BDR25DRAFT_239190, partial [Lindgomyces ingoldianus]